MYKTVVWMAAMSGIVVLFLNVAAQSLYWYVAWPWFDMPMHTLGGAFVALGGAMIFFGNIRTRTSIQVYITLILFVFIIGLAWEYYEYIVQFYIKSVRLADVSDSISDLICDMVGGSVAIFFVILLKNRYNRTNE